MAPDPEEETGAAEEKKRDFTAVVYFHGMGSQRRYEETSRLIESIDTHLAESRKRNDDVGAIRRIKPRLEPHSQDPARAVTYINSRYIPKGAKTDAETSDVRYYAVYWAPIMAGSGDFKGVVTWMFSQVPQPFRMMFSKWRERQRLRRSALVELMDKQPVWPEGVTADDFERLARLYDDFEGIKARGEFQTGSFEEFRAYLDKATEKQKPEVRARLHELTRLWFRHYVRSEITNAFALVSLALALLLAFFGAAALVLVVLRMAAALLPQTGNDLFVWIAGMIKPTWQVATGLVLSAIAFFGLRGFLVDFMGDVQAWATYEETDEKHQRRNRVIETGLDVLKHVLGHPQCKRVLLVSHSLGTTVAHDTLLSLARSNLAFNADDPITGPADMRKISHFVTIASPIDKVEYFFESYSSSYHRYKRVVEDLRGDIGRAPFSRNDKPYVHWVNFWDHADIISGPLHSPANARELANRVDNVCVSSLYFPDPGPSHSAYFQNSKVLRPLFEMIYRDAYDFQTLKSVNRKPKNYAGMFLGPGDPTNGTKLFFGVGLAVPWLVLIGLAFYAFGWQGPGRWAFVAAVVAIAALVISWITGKGRGLRSPP